MRRRGPTEAEITAELAALARVLETSGDRRIVLYALGARAALEWMTRRPSEPMSPSRFAELFGVAFGKVLRWPPRRPPPSGHAG